MKINTNGVIDKNNNRFFPTSFKFISSCIKTASSGVRSAGVTVAASISGDAPAHKDEVLWTCFDKLELGPSLYKSVLLLGYLNGFQVLDVEDATNVGEIVSRHDDPVTFLQMLPLPAKSKESEGFIASHPLLLVVACDESNSSGPMQNGRDGLGRDGYTEPQAENIVFSPSAVRFYSLKSHKYVHILRFRSTVYMVRCSPRIVAVGLAAQIYCFDTLTLENKFSVLTYPVPQLGGQGMTGINVGYGPMAVGARWLAYAPNYPLFSNTGRLSPQTLTPTGVSPSTSPGSGSLMARYAMESSKQLAAGLINIGDIGYKTLSKYCQELIPEVSSSPVSSNSIWRANRIASHSTETEIAGMVTVKDFPSRAVVSQFRAHTSPISALCFDPSGTLLVTASIHGNNINIFRIMPARSQNGSVTQSYDWNSSHVHLYKLHRGMTSAVIQDICFSNYSQWIAIVSSRGTCHIFVLSPFGGETVLQIKNSHANGPTLLPVVSLPWWFTPSFCINKESSSPPPPVTLSVISRIKDGNSGWLSTVSNAASSAAGKVFIPSGAVAAVFHSSIPHDLQPADSKTNALEHLLVYSPSGHLIQYKLLPSVGGDPSDNALRTGPRSSLQIQDEELRVKVEPVRWWDVCRRKDWPEREDCISGTVVSSQEAEQILTNTSNCVDNEIGNKELVKPHERSHLYLSNAEVQMNSVRIPIWQKSKVYICTMSPVGDNEQSFSKESSGEIEIEKIPFHDVEIRRKDVCPRRSDQGDSLIGGRCSGSLFDSHGRKEKPDEDHFISHSQLLSPGPVENLDCGTMCTLTNGSLPAGRPIAKEVKSSKGFETSEVSMTSPNHSYMSKNILYEGPIHNSPEFDQYFQEGYYKASNLCDCDESSEVVTNTESNNSPRHREISEGDGNGNDMLGCVFAFSEED